MSVTLSGEISFNFHNLLPTAMKGVERWRDFVSAYQEVFQEFFTQEVTPLGNQFQYDALTISGCVNLATTFGYTISNYEGYSNSLEYFKREAASIPSRIRTKTLRKSYQYTEFVYYMVGDVYPLYLDTEFGLVPVTDWWTTSDSRESITCLDYDMPDISYYTSLFTDTPGFIIDNGLAFDIAIPVYASTVSTTLTDPTLDDSRILTLDSFSLLDSLTRNILVTYTPLLAENTTEFYSANTMKAFYNDTQQMKRATETLYYEPLLQFYYTGDGNETITNYKYLTDKNTLASTQNSILLGATFSGITVGRVEFGNSRHPILNPGITTVANKIYEIGSGQIIQDTTNGFTVRRVLPISGVMVNFSEIAVFDSSSGIVLYSKFPTVNFHSEMLANVKLEFNEI